MSTPPKCSVIHYAIILIFVAPTKSVAPLPISGYRFWKTLKMKQATAPRTYPRWYDVRRCPPVLSSLNVPDSYPRTDQHVRFRQNSFKDMIIFHFFKKVQPGLLLFFFYLQKYHRHAPKHDSSYISVELVSSFGRCFCLFCNKTLQICLRYSPIQTWLS